MYSRPWALAFLIVGLAVGCGKAPETPATGAGTPPATTGTTTAASTTSGLKDLKTVDVKVGKGPAAANGDQVWVLYTGRLTNENGTVFDSTDKRDNKPFPVVIGGGMVIQGWDKGLVGIKKDGERNLYIPYKLAYGEAGQGSTIPPKADLFFNIKAVALVKKGDEDLVDISVKKPGTGPTAKSGDKVTVSYVGKLPTGDVFDDRSGSKSVTFIIDKPDAKGSRALPGLEFAVKNMKVGEEAIVTIPPKLGIPTGTMNIPSDSVLIFDLTLKKIG